MDPTKRKCTDCGGEDFVEDRAAGDVTCTGCGLVAESRIIDESAEWRSFADSDKPGADMNRVGGIVNHFMTDSLSLTIGNIQNGTTTDASMAGLQSLQRAHARGADPDRLPRQAASVIGRLADELKLKSNIKDRANELFATISPLKLTRGRGMEAVCSALLFVACAAERNPRTFKEIMRVASTAKAKDVKRSFKAIDKFLKEQPQGALKRGGAVGALHVADILSRFCSQLGFSHANRQHAISIAEAACPREPSDARSIRPWDARQPTTIAGAVLYMLSCLPSAAVHPTSSDIARVLGMAESTIRLVYAELKPYAAEFVPRSAASAADLEKLP